VRARIPLRQGLRPEVHGQMKTGGGVAPASWSSTSTAR
jgi:hypothetical protein